MPKRQLWNFLPPSTTERPRPPRCTPFTLPSNGVITIDISTIITLATDAVFQPECTGTSEILLTEAGASPPATLTDSRDPFYASTLPICYVLAATTVIAYMLVIMLLITPRTFLREGAVVLGRRGFTNGPSSSDTGIGIGGRPWLQKVAALTVAISLTIASADTFRVAESQYQQGYQDAGAVQDFVQNGLQLKIIRVISDTFLWLAQAQTLIRLFPRQREKIIIKWTAFALISLDVLFGCLDNFVYNSSNRPRSFVDAIPALSYLFQLALSLLYCAWVIYYSITKKQFAFYHIQMRNISLVALLSLASVLVPVVFFVLDIAKPALAGWGDYVRWVGAAAASVVVWEWVERIEALERDDKKDGVLGREVFDGDEMLDMARSSTQRRQNGQDEGGDDRIIAKSSNGKSWPTLSALSSSYRRRGNDGSETARGNGGNRSSALPAAGSAPPIWPTRPPATATPVSRTDTASAESTVYAIRYHPIGETPPFIDESVVPKSRSNSLVLDTVRCLHEDVTNETAQPVTAGEVAEPTQVLPNTQPKMWKSFLDLSQFRRKGESIDQDTKERATQPDAGIAGRGHNRWDIRSRVEDFAATQAEKLRGKPRRGVDDDVLPVTVIPAPPRRRNLVAALDEIEEAERGQAIQAIRNTERSTGGNSLTADNRQRPRSRTGGSHVSFTQTAPPLRSSSGGSRNLPPLPPPPSQRGGLPVIVIPAPPRRPRVNED